LASGGNSRICDDMQVILANYKADLFGMHNEEEDGKLFPRLKGTHFMQFKRYNEVVRAGEIYCVPKGIERLPKQQETTKGSTVFTFWKKFNLRQNIRNVQHERSQATYQNISMMRSYYM